MDYIDYISELNTLASDEIAIRKRAAQLHESVNQMYGDHPYSAHLNIVAYFTAKYMWKILDSKNDIIPVMFGAYFHDSIEDARLTYNDVLKIAKEYMSEKQALLAAEIVYALTNEKGRNRAERANEKYYMGIRHTPYAPLVKAADRLANYEFAKSTEGKRRMMKAYEKEMPNFIEELRYIPTEYCLGEFRFEEYSSQTKQLPQEMIDELLNKEQ